MRFNNIWEMVEHPLIRAIPLEMLQTLFNRTFSELYLDLMRTRIAELRLRIGILRGHTTEDKFRYWFCIALGHSTASDAELESIADRLDIPISERFKAAVISGRLAMLNQFLAALPSSESIEIIRAKSYYAFRLAAHDGHLPIMERLIAQAPADKLEMIKAVDYHVFKVAASRGHLSVMERLIALAPSLKLNLIRDDYGHYSVFYTAAGRGQLAVMEKLRTLAPTEILNMIRADDSTSYRAFSSAAEQGHLPVLERLIALAPNDVPYMIRANNYRAICDAARAGKLAVVERIIELALADRLRAPTLLEHIKAFVGITTDALLNMIKAEDYIAFRMAAKGGALPLMEQLMTHAPAKIQHMIRADNFGAFRLAAEKGQLAVIERLIALAPVDVQSMIRADNFGAFHLAAEQGHLPVLERLITLAPTYVQSMIKADNFGAFQLAALEGHLPVMERLIALAPGNVQNMIIAGNYGAFRKAAEGGHLPIIERLIELAPAEALNMIQAEEYYAFRKAAELNHLPVINRLLSFPNMMAHAEMHEREYSYFTHPYITNKLSSLRSQRQTLEAANPHAVFDVDNNYEAHCYFFIITNLIRRNDPALLDDIRFLLEIPAVKALAHAAVEFVGPNSLVRLALRTGNQAAAEVLLTIPAVRNLAARHGFYRDEALGVIDLGALAQDRESSMHALSTGEQNRLAAALAHYQPMVHAAGVDHLFDQLIAELVNRYQRHPATITINGVTTVLPVDWEEFNYLSLIATPAVTPALPPDWGAFNHLSLTAAQRQESLELYYQHSLKAYYQHKDHTALRYLSCPNPWMAQNASYVYVSDDRTQRWSTFEEYKPLIVMLWLAAQDVTIPPTDGHTLEGRITHFIDELALIGRAHNWDSSRNRVDGSGHSIEEEFDDLTGDKPSCFSGVKRRLFQSVIGHPLLKMLTAEDIKQELRDFVRSHFIRLINEGNRVPLMNAWDNYCVSLDLADAAPLRALNISTEQQAAIIAQLTTKYGHQFSNEPRFRNTITTAFTLVESASNPSDCMHALKFSGLVNLGQLLQVPVTGVTFASSIGFFAEGAGQIAEANDHPAAVAGMNSRH